MKNEFVLIIDIKDKNYLQIGEIIDEEIFEYGKNAVIFTVQFSDRSVVRYNYEEFCNKCKLLELK